MPTGSPYYNPYGGAAVPYGSNYSMNALRSRYRATDEPDYSAQLAAPAIQREVPAPIAAPPPAQPVSLASLAGLVGRPFELMDGESWEGSRRRQEDYERIQGAVQDQILHQGDPAWQRMNQMDDLNQQAAVMKSPAFRDLAMTGQQLGNERGLLAQQGMYDLWASPEARQISEYEDERIRRLAEEANAPILAGIEQKDRASERGSMDSLNKTLIQQQTARDKAQIDNQTKVFIARLNATGEPVTGAQLQAVNEWRTSAGLEPIQAGPAPAPAQGAAGPTTGQASPSPWYKPMAWWNRGRSDPDQGPRPAQPTMPVSPTGRDIYMPPGYEQGGWQQAPSPAAAPAAQDGDRTVTISEVQDVAAHKGINLEEALVEAYRRGYTVVPDPMQ